MLQSRAPFGGVVHVSVQDDAAGFAVAHALGGDRAHHIRVADTGLPDMTVE